MLIGSKGHLIVPLLAHDGLLSSDDLGNTRCIAGYRIPFIGLAAAVVLLGTACGSDPGSGPSQAGAMRAAASATRLRALLAAAHVPVGRGKTPAASSFSAAWATFQRFARIPVDRRDLSGDEPNDDLLFEFGVFESNFWGTSFEVEFTRQYGMASGDLQQVHLVVHFPVAAFIAITRNLRATPCLRGAGCVFSCFFAGNDVLVPHPCRVVAQGTGGYRVGDMTLWASQTAGSDVSTQRMHWNEGVESSPVFRALLSRHIRPDGYEVWQESAE